MMKLLAILYVKVGKMVLKLHIVSLFMQYKEKIMTTLDTTWATR